MQYKPKKSRDKITDPTISIVTGIGESLATVLTGIEAYHCGNENCNGIITRKIGGWPKRCSKCGEEIDWLEVALIKECPECNKRYFHKDDMYCIKHETRVELIPLE